jgi:hypothetical protein
MTTEVPLQVDMFNGEHVDTRNAKQKRADRALQQPKPIEMFSQREIAQFGVVSRPLMPISDKTRLALQVEDPRTEEEIERDIQREAERNTVQMFSEEPKALIVRPDLRPVALEPLRKKDPQRQQQFLLTAGPVIALLAAGEPVQLDAALLNAADEDRLFFTASQFLRLGYSLI